MDRRHFLLQSSALAGLGYFGLPTSANDAPAKAEPPFRISLAQWSLHKTFFGKKADAADFPKIAKKDYGIGAVEYVNQFYKDKKGNAEYFTALRKSCDDLGVTSVLIMCDGEGALGDADAKKRTQAVENHYAWVEAAKILGCHSIRVNAQSSGTPEEQTDRAADGLRALTEWAAKLKINVIVENHGGLSSNGAWLAGVMKKVNLPGCGTLPDFGNFNLGDGKQYDRYLGVTELMPFAKGVSAKTHDFNAEGDEIHTDYYRMMKIVFDAGYRGYVGIEYEGGKIGEAEGIVATKKLLEKILAMKAK